jgi:maltooligosyltrehalose trehalohydrolase
MLAWYRELLALRRSRPELTDPALDRIRVEFDEDARWLVVYRHNLRIAANLANEAVTLPVERGAIVLAASRHGVTDATLPPASFAVMWAGTIVR